VDAPRIDIELDLIQRDDTGKALGESTDFEESVHGQA
jgi:hypothetical protein